MEEVTPHIPRPALIITLLYMVMESHGAILWPESIRFSHEVKGHVFLGIADVPQLDAWARVLDWQVQALPVAEVPGRAYFNAGGYVGGWRLTLRAVGPSLDLDATVELARLGTRS